MDTGLAHLGVAFLAVRWGGVGRALLVRPVGLLTIETSLRRGEGFAAGIARRGHEVAAEVAPWVEGASALVYEGTSFTRSSQAMHMVGVSLGIVVGLAAARRLPAPAVVMPQHAKAATTGSRHAGKGDVELVLRRRFGSEVLDALLAELPRRFHNHALDALAVGTAWVGAQPFALRLLTTARQGEADAAAGR